MLGLGRRRARPLDGRADGLQAIALAEGRAATAHPGMPRQTARDLIVESLAGKVLHGWTANRHQTLFPLSINFRRLDSSQAALLAEMIAATLLACGVGTARQRLPFVRSWLHTVGGDEATLALIDTALDHPAPLADLLARIEAAKLAPSAYSVALASCDHRIIANRLFLDYLAARLDIPSEMARSLAQRFRS